MTNNRLVNIILFIFFFLSLIFIVFPELDIKVSSLFFKQEIGFLYKTNFLVVFLYKIIPLSTKIFAISCLGYLIYLFLKFKNFKKVTKSLAFFLLLCAIISPGIIINLALKENFGRARPREIVEFEGKKTFSRAFTISQECTSNCSFSSGHAAMGFYFSAIAYASTFYFTRIYLTSVLFGCLIGISRIIMGGHFASDVVVSAFLVLLVNHIIYLLWKKKSQT